MLVYLSKKIAIPNNCNLHCISWNRDQGWIACGGDEGQAKVLKLDAPSGPDAKVKGIAAPSNLLMNQNLEGHEGSVVCCTWNPVYKKLTTSDQKGLIIVWTLHRGAWTEEMINNRNKSVVKDMKWTNDGKKICIVYEDGAIIVGSVDGSRLWGKELNILLKFVEWSPDCRLLLFVTQDNDVLVYDSDGTRIKTMALPALREGGHHDDVSIAGLHWFEGAFGSKAANDLFFAPLCVVLSNGIVQMSRNEEDANPVVFSTDMTVKGCRWNPSGTVIAINGVVTQPVSSADGGSQVKQLNLIKFYDRSGNMLRAMRIPGENLEALTWDAGGLRLALAVDSFIYFANVRPAYTWCHFLNTVAYLYQRREPTIQFWNLTTNEMHPKYIPGGVHFLVACGDHCLIVTSDLNKDSADLAAQKASGEKSKKPQNYILQLRNGIGALVASKSIPFVPKYVCMGPNHVAAANERTIYTWQFQSAVTRAGMVAGPKMGSFDEDDNGRPQDKSSSTYASGAYHGKERMIDVESVHSAQAQAPETFRIITESLDDPISCICTSDRHLMIGRRSGSIVRLLLPHLSAENVYQVRGEPFRLALSCMSSKLAIIDAVGILQLLDLEARVSNGDNNEPTEGSQFGQKIGVDRRDVWDIIWAEDNDDLLCFMEKTKMGVIRGDAAEEPVVSSGYLARFRDLEVRAVLLDEIFAAPEKPERDCVVDFETKALHELRELILRSGLEFAYNYALKNPHSRLFRILAEQALETGELTIAEKCFVNINDYHGIQLVKQLRSMPDKMKVKAEVAAYLQRFDEAETIYRDIDRKDLAIQLRNRIGDYNRVVQLLHSGGGSDKLLNAAWDKIAEHYADRFMWKKAAQYFQESRNFERLAECYYRLENFEELSKMRADISDGTPLLLTLANRFESVGMYEDAVDCYIRSGDPKSAVDCCVLQNRWDKALELAEQFDFPQVEGLLLRVASHLQEKGRKLEAVELYRRANRPTAAALLINEIAEQIARRDVKPSLAKRLQVLSAYEIERHRKRALDAATKATLQGGGTDAGGATKNSIALATAATLETLMMTSLDTQTTGLATLTTATGGRKASRAFGNAWRAAAAYHFQMLAQKQYYEGNMDAAMKTSIKLCEYDDILSPRDIYSLLALTSLGNKFFAICSQAFVKLETLQDIPAEERDAIETLAVQVFIRNAPTDPVTLPDVYSRCLAMGKAYRACVASGRAVLDSDVIECKTCRHPILAHERKDLESCPLCHSLLPPRGLGSQY